jgi:hypothetical protein
VAETCSVKTFSWLFYSHLINWDELCCTRDSVLKEIIRKRCNGMLRYNILFTDSLVSKFL